MAKILQDKIDLLPKHAKGLAVVHLIRECIEHPNIFVYGELLDLPNVQSLKDNPETEPWLRLLNIFAFGTYQEYRIMMTSLPTLTPSMEHKLRALSIISLAEKSKKIAYNTLLKELEMDSLRSLEDLLIDVIYTKAIEGKMDQKNGWIEIESTIARDIKREQLDSISSILTSWCENCDNVLSNIDAEIKVANSLKADNVQKKQELEAKIAALKATVKSSGPASQATAGLDFDMDDFDQLSSQGRGSQSSPHAPENLFGRVKQGLGRFGGRTGKRDRQKGYLK